MKFDHYQPNTLTPMPCNMWRGCGVTFRAPDSGTGEPGYSLGIGSPCAYKNVFFKYMTIIIKWRSF